MSFKLALLAIVASASLSHAQDVQLARSYVGSRFVDGFGAFRELLPAHLPSQP